MHPGKNAVQKYKILSKNNRQKFVAVRKKAIQDFNTTGFKSILLMLISLKPSNYFNFRCFWNAPKKGVQM